MNKVVPYLLPLATASIRNLLPAQQEECYNPTGPDGPVQSRVSEHRKRTFRRFPQSPACDPHEDYTAEWETKRPGGLRARGNRQKSSRTMVHSLGRGAALYVRPRFPLPQQKFLHHLRVNTLIPNSMPLGQEAPGSSARMFPQIWIPHTLEDSLQPSYPMEGSAIMRFCICTIQHVVATECLTCS